MTHCALMLPSSFKMYIDFRTNFRWAKRLAEFKNVNWTVYKYHSHYSVDFNSETWVWRRRRTSSVYNIYILHVNNKTTVKEDRFLNAYLPFCSFEILSVRWTLQVYIVYSHKCLAITRSMIHIVHWLLPKLYSSRYF